jgi:hypothetical protein
MKIASLTEAVSKIFKIGNVIRKFMNPYRSPSKFLKGIVFIELYT